MFGSKKEQNIFNLSDSIDLISENEAYLSQSNNPQVKDILMHGLKATPIQKDIQTVKLSTDMLNDAISKFKTLSTPNQNLVIDIINRLDDLE